MTLPLSCPISERGVLAGIFQYGASAYSDVADMLSENSFTIDSNQILYKCFKHILTKEDSQTLTRLDYPSVLAASSEVGLSHILDKKSELSHFRAITSLNVELANVRKFAAKIRKLEIARLLRQQLEQAQSSMLETTGDESITEIIGRAEDAIFDFSSLFNDDSNNPRKLGEDAQDYIQERIDNPVQQMGISTGYHVYDQVIGGGLRPGVTVINSRMKQGKTSLADNISKNISSDNIPVLCCDTEMLSEDHMSRMLASLSGIPITAIETGKFAKNAKTKQQIIDAGKKLKSLPYYHKNNSGKPFEEQIAIMRRWLTKEVGLNRDGTAKPCIIIYDYLKLMDSKDLKNDLKEYQLLGFMMTTLQNFGLRYKVPILAFNQLNRDGITKEDTSGLSGSDRIAMFCISSSIFKNKSDEEIQTDGVQNGNKKLFTHIARYGPGHEDGNYINFNMKGWCCQIEEKKTKFELEQEKEDNKNGFVSDGNKSDSSWSTVDDIPFN